jgi:hypothetical protein
LLGRAYFQKGDAARALEEFRLAVRLNPEDTISRMMVDKITLFPLPPGEPASKAGGVGRSTTLERDAKAERERLLSGKTLPGTAGAFRLLIDPGHGGSDPGAAGPGLRESDVALDVSLRLARVLEDQAKGTVEVFLTRVVDPACRPGPGLPWPAGMELFCSCPYMPPVCPIPRSRAWGCLPLPRTRRTRWRGRGQGGKRGSGRSETP